ncbi:unnamed protein product, partial [Meganyctiphanes norvegica]
NIVFFITTYILPMLVMLISYTLIGRELWGSHSIGELTDRQANSIRSKRRAFQQVVRMFIVIVVVFALCWFPQQGFFLYQYHNSHILSMAYIQHIYLGFYWLAMANAMINPLIYYWMNARFRAYFREMVLQCLSPTRCCSRGAYLDSPRLSRIPGGTSLHSRSRSDGRCDGNGSYGGVADTGGTKQGHLLVYSSRGRMNGTRGGLPPTGLLPTRCNSNATGLVTENIPLREFRSKNQPEGKCCKKHSKNDKNQDWHHLEYISDQLDRSREENSMSPRSPFRFSGTCKSSEPSRSSASNHDYDKFGDIRDQIDSTSEKYGLLIDKENLDPEEIDTIYSPVIIEPDPNSGKSENCVTHADISRTHNGHTNHIPIIVNSEILNSCNNVNVIPLQVNSSEKVYFSDAEQNHRQNNETLLTKSSSDKEVNKRNI